MAGGLGAVAAEPAGDFAEVLGGRRGAPAAQVTAYQVVDSAWITKQSAALVGASDLSVLGVEAHVRSAELMGSSAITVDGKSAASIMVELNCGAIPTAQDVAQATLQMTVEAGLSLKDVLRLLLATAAGDATGLDANPAFKSQDGGKTRLAGTRSGGDRTITTIDPS